MKHWFTHAFDHIYLQLYAHRSEDEAQQTVAWLVEELGLQPGMLVLDAPCGAGRHCRALRTYGLEVVGIDLSESLLHTAQTVSANHGILWSRGDLRYLPFRPASFDVVVNIFSSFGYFFEDAENEAVVAEFSAVLKPHGVFVLDFMNASHVRKTLVPFSKRKTEEGWELLEWRQIQGCPPRVEKKTLVRLPDGTERHIIESVRLYEPDELVHLVGRHSFRDLRLFGDYQGSPYMKASPRCIIIGRKEP
ncbi:MAG: class I SAM-dependent methyltransferase [Candidatus Sumerlaeaceae bacterium]|nr:class I SAM-dependent methyltransferase [Candidatus Sumerlaeaceae bacterium]